MQVFTGIDLMPISSIKTLLGDEECALRVFTSAEWEYIYNGDEIPAHRAAGIFCAKEAVLKAMGTGFVGYTPTDLEILHNDLGAPLVRFREEKRPKGTFSISIAHSGDYATASAVWMVEEI